MARPGADKIDAGCIIAGKQYVTLAPGGSIIASRRQFSR